jgi:hypothetical protein
MARFKACFAKCGYGLGSNLEIQELEDKPWDEDENLSSERFHSEKVEDPNLLYSCLFIHKFAWLHMNSLAIYQKDGSKDYPWNHWMIELYKNSLSLLTHDGTTASKKSSILHQNPWIRSLGEESKKRGWLFSSSPWRGWGVKGVHGLLLVLPFFLSSIFFDPFSNLSPL